MKDQLFVGHHETSVETDFLALFVHRRYSVVPFDETLSVGVQIESGDRDLRKLEQNLKKE